MPKKKSNFISLFLIALGAHYVFDAVLPKKRPTLKYNIPIDYKKELNDDHDRHRFGSHYEHWSHVKKFYFEDASLYYGLSIPYIEHPELAKSIILSLQDSLGKHYSDCETLDFKNRKDSPEVVAAIKKAVYKTYPLLKAVDNLPPEEYVNGDLKIQYKGQEVHDFEKELRIWHYARKIFYHYICGVPDEELYL